MSGREHQFIFMAVAITLLSPLTVSEGGPIEPCEYDDQLVADKYSCTRYHVCRRLEGGDEFATDIAICSPGKVFDMVLSECVDYETGFLQDPAGCTTFYGCHPTKETSEGFLRRNYTCPGDLRFNPEEKFCTFKTNVTDDLCNSRNKDQRIIGDVALRAGTSRVTVRSNNHASDYHPPPEVSKILSQGTFPVKSLTSTVKPRVPPQHSNLDRIAQVISGQLLSLHKREKNAVSDTSDYKAQKDHKQEKPKQETIEKEKPKGK